MGAVRRGYARRFGAAADTCCALRQCRFAALTLFVARFCLRVPSGVLGMCPSWAFCCAPWLDIPAGCSVVLSGPMMGIHYIQLIAFVTECRRFGLMQFPSSQHPFFILALRLFRHSRSLLSAGCKFDFAALRMRYCMGRVGRVWHCSACAKLPLISTLSLFLGFFHLLFVLAPGLLRVYCWCLLEQFALA